MWMIITLLCLSVSMIQGDRKCLARKGRCQEDYLACAGSYVSYLCAGRSSRRCCVPRSSGDSKCLARKGKCQADYLNCAGRYVSYLCAGRSSRRCCVPGAGSSSGDGKCLAKKGKCQYDGLACAGRYISFHCAGSKSRRCCLPKASSSGGCSNVNIISRSSWGARSPTSKSYLSTPVSLMFIHHTDTPACNSVTSCSSRVRGIQKYHMTNKGWSDIAYSFLVGEDGNVYEGRGWNRVGAHTKGYNSRGLAISFIGDYTSRNPPSSAITAAKRLIACGVSKKKVKPGYRLYGHRDVGRTSCPGLTLYNTIKKWPRYSTIKP